MRCLLLQLPLLVRRKPLSCSSIISSRNSEYPGRLFRIGTLGGKEISGKKYATEWEGPRLLLNPHFVSLLRNKSGRGRKVLMKYNGPFEVIDKHSPVSCRRQMPGCG